MYMNALFWELYVFLHVDLFLYSSAMVCYCFPPPYYVQAKFIFQQICPGEEFFPQPLPQPQMGEEELPPQQQEGDAKIEHAKEGHKDDREEVEGGDLAAQAAEETVSAAEASN